MLAKRLDDHRQRLGVNLRQRRLAGKLDRETQAARSAA